MPTTMEIGKRLCELCDQEKNLDAVNELYADNVVSLETHAMPDMPARMEGKPAIIKKNQWFFDNHTIHSSKSSGPFPHGDQFVLLFKMACTPKIGPMAGKRIDMEEAALYTVKNGKIVEEKFFYDMGG
jgi:hypothetical protein